MLLDVESCESSDQAAYKQACITKEQIELETLCYHPCHFVRSRAVSRVNKRYRLPDKITKDISPAVLLSVLMRRDFTDDDLNRIGVHISVTTERQEGCERDDRYDGVLKHIVSILNARMSNIPGCPIANCAVKPKTEVRNILGVLRDTSPTAVILKRGWHAYANHWSPKVRVAVIRRKDCPDEILRSFLKDPNWLVYLRAWYKLVIEKM